MSVSQPPSDSQAIVDSLLGEATEACRTEAERARRLNEILSRCEAIREQQAKFAKESARGVPIDTPDASLAFLRGELGDVYPLPSLAPLWVAAQSLNLGGVPRWPGEPQTGPEAFEDLDALADWCRRQMGRPAVLLPAAGGRTAPTSVSPEKPATDGEGDAGRKGEVSDREPSGDGPFGTDGFRFQEVEVRFGRAARQRSLVLALWDAAHQRPRDARPIEDVLTDVYGEDHDTADSAFRQLCAELRRRLETSAVPLTIEAFQGTVVMKTCPL